MAETVEGGCHCGAVRFALAAMPAEVAQCNCSICTKLGWLVGYCPPGDFTLLRGEAAMSSYVWGDRLLASRFCTTCGCRVYWHAVPGRESECFPEPATARVGFNARLIDGIEAEQLPRRLVDGRSF